jgi:hypothetical protein
MCSRLVNSTCSSLFIAAALDSTLPLKGSRFFNTVGNLFLNLCHQAFSTGNHSLNGFFDVLLNFRLKIWSSFNTDLLTLGNSFACSCIYINIQNLAKVKVS